MLLPMAQGQQDQGGLAPNPVHAADLAVLAGWLAVVEGELMAATGSVPADLAGRLRQRLEDAGLLADNADERALRQAINDVNHRLRYALGEYTTPLAAVPVPR